MDPFGGSCNQGTVEIVEVAKSRWLRNQSVDRDIIIKLHIVELPDISSSHGVELGEEGMSRTSTMRLLMG